MFACVCAVSFLGTESGYPLAATSKLFVVQICTEIVVLCVKSFEVVFDSVFDDLGPASAHATFSLIFGDAKRFTKGFFHGFVPQGPKLIRFEFLDIPVESSIL